VQDNIVGRPTDRRGNPGGHPARVPTPVSDLLLTTQPGGT